MEFRVNQYQISYYTDHHERYAAKIKLIGHQGIGTEATVYIMKAGVSVLPNNISKGGLIGTIYYEFERFDLLLDILRNEKPLSIYANPDYADFAIIYTGDEPVGEGE